MGPAVCLWRRTVWRRLSAGLSNFRSKESIFLKTCRAVKVLQILLKTDGRNSSGNAPSDRDGGGCSSRDILITVFGLKQHFGNMFLYSIKYFIKNEIIKLHAKTPTGQKQREEMAEMDMGDWWGGSGGGAPMSWCNNMTKHFKSNGDHQKHQHAAADGKIVSFSLSVCNSCWEKQVIVCYSKQS